MNQFDCPVCEHLLIGQEGFPLLRCGVCDRWFEIQDDEIVALRLETLGRLI